LRDNPEALFTACQPVFRSFARFFTSTVQRKCQRVHIFLCRMFLHLRSTAHSGLPSFSLCSAFFFSASSLASYLAFLRSTSMSSEATANFFLLSTAPHFPCRPGSLSCPPPPPGAPLMCQVLPPKETFGLLHARCPRSLGNHLFSSPISSWADSVRSTEKA